MKEKILYNKRIGLNTLRALNVFFLFLFVSITFPTIAQQHRSISIQERDSIAFELSQIYGFDQGIRNAKLNKPISYKLLPSIDSLNFEKFIQIVEKYGIPTKKLMGDYHQHYSIKGVTPVILLHNPHRIIEPKIYNLLKKEVKEGRLPAEALAIYLDKYYVMYEKKSIYNSDFKAWVESKGVLLSDKQKSDSLRMDIGLDVLPDSVFITP